MPAVTVPKRSDAAVRSRLKELRDRVRKEAKDIPGTYRMLSEGGEVVYVGKSKRLRSRLMSYFRGAYPEDKGARIVREAHAIEWTGLPSEFAALLEELRQIKRYRPRFNVALKRDARHYAFVAVTRGTAPRLVVLRGTGTRGESTVFGPFVGAAQLEESLRALSDSLGLRDCSHDRRMQFSDQREIFPPPPRTPGCIRHEIGTCLGPCIAAPTANDYADRLAQARAFLDGADLGPMTRLELAMREASDRLEYERAGVLRDRLQRLEGLREQFARLRFAVETLSFTYHVPGVSGEDRVYLIRRGVVRQEWPAPRTTAEELALAERARHGLGVAPAAPSASLPAHEIDELLVVTSWFRSHPEEMERTKRW